MSQPLSPLTEQDTDVITSDVNSTASISSKSGTLRDAVRAAAKEYFIKLEGSTSANLLWRIDFLLAIRRSRSSWYFYGLNSNQL